MMNAISQQTARNPLVVTFFNGMASKIMTYVAHCHLKHIIVSPGLNFTLDTINLVVFSHFVCFVLNETTYVSDHVYSTEMDDIY